GLGGERMSGGDHPMLGDDGRSPARPSALLGATLSLSPLDVARGDPEVLEGSKGRGLGGEMNNARQDYADRNDTFSVRHHLLRSRRMRPRFNRTAGSRLRRCERGSTSIPTDSSAVTPRIGSASSGP